MSTASPSMLSIHRQDLPGDIHFNMIEVKGGQFLMGDDEGEYPFWDPKPAHKVELGTFFIGQFPVTQRLWAALMGENPSSFKGANRPVDSVSWDDCQEFIQRLNEQLELKGKKQYRLPREAEWEYAARGGTDSKGYTYSGSEDLDRVASYRNNSRMETQPEGLVLPNELGIYEMSGNVWEWCQDWFDDNYYQDCHQKGVVKNPQGPNSGRLRVLRGGSWINNASLCRVAHRYGLHPDDRRDACGLRLSRTEW